MRPTLYSFNELSLAVDRALLFATLGASSNISFFLDEFLKDDPHVIMLMT
jgi:hypothetical protein